MHFTLHLAKKRLGRFATAISDWAIFIGFILIVGLGSSWYMVSSGSALTTRSEGAWVSWTAAGRTDADPYTRAHFARIGTLDLTTEIAGTYIARSDDDGLNLHSSCEYRITGGEIDASWWSITAFDDVGRLIPNPVDRHAFTSETVAVSPDGTFVITLARDARAGNWLPTGGAGRLALALTIVEGASSIVSGSEPEYELPQIARVQCR
ncbi:MAG: DUF1214 domain-containing protein [Hyphomicrobiaceae bacterium]|nr:DUF1214 domain-containing protein [Hyphomicrobiaceae bacterium]